MSSTKTLTAYLSPSFVGLKNSISLTPSEGLKLKLKAGSETTSYDDIFEGLKLSLRCCKMKKSEEKECV